MEEYLVERQEMGLGIWVGELFRVPELAEWAQQGPAAKSAIESISVEVLGLDDQWCYGFDKLAIELLTGFNADRVVSPVACGAVHELIGKHRR